MSQHEKIGLQPDRLPTDGLTSAEDQELARLLSKWRGERISAPVFTELARMVPQPIVEVVILRINNGVVEALLIPRPEDDIVWPGMYHTPGTALRVSDFYRDDNAPLNGAFERIQRGELKSEFADTPMFAGHLHRHSNRGPEVVEAYIAELSPAAGLQPDHMWYPVDRLQDNPRFIQSQLEHVRMAAEVYKKGMDKCC